MPLALPYPGNGITVPAARASDRFHAGTGEGVAIGRQTRSRIVAVEAINFAVDDQRRQPTSGVNSRIFVQENRTAASGTSPAARILGELIHRMGGSGTYSGPGKVLNIAV